MSIEHGSQEKLSLTLREYLGLLIPERQVPTKEEIAEIVTNPEKPFTFREYLGVILPKR